jgi:hypothetical protein
VPPTGLEAGMCIEDAAELAAAVQEYGLVSARGGGKGRHEGEGPMGLRCALVQGGAHLSCRLE